MTDIAEYHAELSQPSMESIVANIGGGCDQMKKERERKSQDLLLLSNNELFNYEKEYGIIDTLASEEYSKTELRFDEIYPDDGSSMKDYLNWKKENVINGNGNERDSNGELGLAACDEKCMWIYRKYECGLTIMMKWILHFYKIFLVNIKLMDVI